MIGLPSWLGTRRELSPGEQFDRRWRRINALQSAAIWAGGIAVCAGLFLALHWNDALSVAARRCSAAGWERSDPAYRRCVQMERRQILVERAERQAEEE